MDKTELGCLRAVVLFNPGTYAFNPGNMIYICVKKLAICDWLLIYGFVFLNHIFPNVFLNHIFLY